MGVEPSATKKILGSPSISAPRDDDSGNPRIYASTDLGEFPPRPPIEDSIAGWWSLAGKETWNWSYQDVARLINTSAVATAWQIFYANRSA